MPSTLSPVLAKKQRSSLPALPFVFQVSHKADSRAQVHFKARL